ncbi:restriction endonuclease [Pseudomonas sp. Irchel s3a12]|uniref:restriction endonuclease n=1 Tax=Pseudomonas sp. Irchel s3a12 TaxID=2009047 RepID=UPI000BA45CA7|nr:restriction endonuclease [Pseudomonas sp. Irchel s3a12]
MGILDFREIPSASGKLRKARKANLEKEDLDAFEKFAEEYFEKIVGATIINRTTRGPDNDLDLKVSINGIKVLISCKHYAHSDNAVGADQELDPLSAVYSNGCSKFIGFYSSAPSSALVTKLEGIKNSGTIPFDYEILKNSDIESKLLDKDSIVGWLFAARYFPKSYSNLFRKFVVPIQHYKLSDLKNTSPSAWILDGPFGGLHSGKKPNKQKIIDEANDALTSNLHASFFAEALKDAIDCFPEYFKYRSNADLNELRYEDISPAWETPLAHPRTADCNVPIIVCGIWSFWCPQSALKKYLTFNDALKDPDSPSHSKLLDHRELTYSAFLTDGFLAKVSSGKYRDIFARLTAFCQLSLPFYKGSDTKKFDSGGGVPVDWKFKQGEGLEFLLNRILNK